MAHLASLLYAPFVLFSLRYFPTLVVALSVVCVSLVWLYRVRKKGVQRLVFPLFYGAMGVVALVLDKGAVLKGAPLLVAVAFFLFFLLPQGGVWLRVVASRFTLLDEKEALYVEKSRYFWAGVALVNVCFHALALCFAPSAYWVFYASLGWYGVFVCGGVVQFLHRKYLFQQKAL